MVNIYEKALQFIKIRPHHSQELRRKLAYKGFAKGEIDDCLDRLSEAGLVNDSDFAARYLESLILHKTLGFYGLKAKLISRGVASNEAEKLLSANFTLEKEAQIAQNFTERFPKTEKVKLAQKLSRRGFRPQVISQILDFMV